MRERLVRVSADSMSRRRDKGHARHKAAPVAVEDSRPKGVAASADGTSCAARGVWRNELEFGSALLLLLVLGLHLGLRVQPELNYERWLPPFFCEMRFLHKHLPQPGGILQYTASGLAHCQVTNGWGALTFTVLLGVAFMAAHCLLATVRKGGSVTLASVWVTLLATLPGRFEGDATGTVLGGLMAAVMGLVWLWGIERAVWARVFSCWALGGLVFWCGGALPMGLFAALVLVLELTRHGRLWPAVACASVVLIIPWWWRGHVGFDALALMAGWGQGWTRVLHGAAFLWLPIGLLLAALTSGSRPRLGQRPWVVWVQSGGRVAAGLAVAWISVDASRQAEARLAYAAGREHWEAVVSHAESVQRWSASSRLHLLRALHHLGRLPEDLFRFPQRRGVSVLPGYQEGLEMGRPLAWTLLELGQVNLAEHMAHEALELEGARPDTLRLLAKVNVLLDRPEAARIFLNRLSLVPYCRPQARAALARLESDPRGEHDVSLARIRGCLPRTDEPDPALPAEALLRQLLAANATNRMAWDYLESHWLLSGHLDALAEGVSRRARGVSGRGSRPCMEALVLRQHLASGTSPLSETETDPAVREAYRQFSELVRLHPEDTPEVRALIGSRLGDTYWYYHRFGETSRHAFQGRGQ